MGKGPRQRWPLFVCVTWTELCFNVMMFLDDLSAPNEKRSPIKGLR